EAGNESVHYYVWGAGPLIMKGRLHRKFYIPANRVTNDALCFVSGVIFFENDVIFFVIEAFFIVRCVIYYVSGATFFVR
ncbi:MAG: hypothetical protein KZQ77_05615, partial [Candidatus Thiodiazotropha sp. (ex Notomyrtea botanica)]|nr:hypothetical protein [Candidatus Thiodiazotropha sp. (ex Notomyrtea botanica)]